MAKQKSKKSSGNRPIIHVLFFLIVIGFLLVDQYRGSTDGTKQSVMNLPASSFYNYDWANRLPIGGNIWYGKLPPGPDSLFAFLEAEHIDLVISLTTEANSYQAVQQIQIECFDAEVEHLTFNVDFYRAPDQRMEQLDLIDRLVERGNVFIHCRHGKHRAPQQAGIRLARAGFTWEEILDALDWWELAEQPGKYRRYVSTVFSELKTYQQDGK